MNECNSFEHKQYLFRRKFWKLFGGAFYVFDPSQNLVFYGKQKAFKLREDFRVYSDETLSKELLTIKTPQILDISATYHVTDSSTGQNIGAVKRKGLKSIIRDEWLFLSTEGQEIGKLSEKSLLSALISRFINLVPQTYIITDNQGSEQAVIKQHFNPFLLKYTMTLADNLTIDKRLLIAAGILLAGIEGRQK